MTENGSFNFLFLHFGKPVRIVVDIVSRCGPSREKANRENPQIFPIGKYKQYSAKIAQSAAEGSSNRPAQKFFRKKSAKG